MTVCLMNSSSELKGKIHPSCMVKEVMEVLNIEKREIIFDATFGTGGHSKEILSSGFRGLLLATEKDPSLFEKGKKLEIKFNNFKIFKRSYVEIPEILKELKIKNIDGVLFDLGISFYHISSSERGFSFKKKEILDMRYDFYEGYPLYYHISKLRERELEDIIRRYGEEKRARIIAKGIVSARSKKEIKTTFDLNEVIIKAVKKGNFEKILQKVYQSFRIWINREIENLERVLYFLPHIVRKGGIVVFLTYHSIEDRIVKRFFRDSSNRFRPLTKKPITPSSVEIKLKPNCRSCKLRAGEKI